MPAKRQQRGLEMWAAGRNRSKRPLKLKISAAVGPTQVISRPGHDVLGLGLQPARYSMRFDRAHMSLDAAAQGLGVALESATIGGRHLAEGKLRAPFGLDKAVQVKAHFAVYPARHAKRAPVEAFLAQLHAEAAKD